MSELLKPDQNFIRVISPEELGGNSLVNLLEWIEHERDSIDHALIDNGGILFRGFALRPQEFRQAADAISQSNMPYTNGATPREKYADGLYLASAFPSTLTLAQHHEMSYMPDYPLKIMFYCETAAPEGGETPVCSTRTFMSKLDPAVLREFEQRRVAYLRNYDERFTAHWRLAFLTDDKRVVERICRESGLIPEWRREDRLRTRGVAEAVVHHPITDELIWHNHAVNFALRSNSPERRTPALRQVAPAFANELIDALVNGKVDDLPTNASFGDGMPIPADALEHISEILEGQKVGFKWQAGDFILLDNLLAFHGRNPFSGPRRILTVLKEPRSQIAQIMPKIAAIKRAA